MFGRAFSGRSLSERELLNRGVVPGHRSIATAGRAIFVMSFAASLLLTTTGAATPTPPRETDETVDRDAEQIDSQHPLVTKQGAEFKRVTRVDALERSTQDDYYRWLIGRIEDGSADKRVMRQYWFARERMLFQRGAPLGWRFPARERLDTPAPNPSSEREAPGANSGGGSGPTIPQQNDLVTSIPQLGRWIQVGPWTIPGRTTGLARPAKRPNEILAAVADGGLWRSRDLGTTWEPLGDREATLASGAVATDPVDPNTYYWGTGEGNGAIDNYGGISVLRTHDGGRTWQRSNHFSGSFRGLTVNPHNRSEIWAAGDRLFRSTDGGANFSRVLGGTPENGPVGVRIHPTNPLLMWSGFWGPGLYKSTDGGNNWVPEGNGLPSGIGRTEVTLCAADPNVMYVYGESDGGDIWKSVDGGATWTTPVDNAGWDPCGGQCWYDMSLATAPDDCNTVYVGGVDGWVSHDGGATWASVGAAGSSVHVDHHSLLTGPGGEAIMSSDGGVFRSTDFGVHWTNIGIGLPTTQYYGACGSDTGANEYAGGTQDNGTHRRRNSDGWSWVLGGDGGMCAIGGNRYLGEYQNTSVQRSIDGGNSWGDANGGIGVNDPRSWVGIFEKDPSNASTLYVGTNSVYRTTNFHDTAWVKILGPIYFGRQVSTIAVSPADRKVIWVGFEYGGLYRTANGLDLNPTFKSVKAGNPDRTVRRVQPHPSDANSAWVVYAGYGYPKILFTSNAGTSYVDRSGDFPDVPVNDLTIDPSNPDVIVAATDLGVYRSDDGGTHWYGFVDGLPPVAAIDIFRHPASSEIVTGTHGRSMLIWRGASSSAVAVPDGKFVAGKQLVTQRTELGRLWLRWDTEACTGAHYNLFFGQLGQVSSGLYDGAICDLSRGGETIIDMPGAPGDSLFFLIAGANAAGVEGPHGFASSGLPRPNNGVGLCGISGHNDGATCP